MTANAKAFVSRVKAQELLGVGFIGTALQRQYCLIVLGFCDAVVRDDPEKGRYVGGAVTNWTLVSLNHDTQVLSRIVAARDFWALVSHLAHISFEFEPLMTLVCGADVHGP